MMTTIVKMLMVQYDGEDNDKNVTATLGDDCHQPRHRS